MPNPPVYDSVRAIGTFRPKFDLTRGGALSPELSVIGTGFWLKGEKVLITCAHVIQNFLGAPVELAGLLVVGKAGNYRRAVIGIADSAHDLAVLIMVDNNGRPIQGEELRRESSNGLALTTVYPDVATPVGYAGFPLGTQLLNNIHSPTYAEGVVGVSQRQNGLQKEIQISGPVAGGFSGSPIVKIGTNEVVGVVANGPQDQANIFMGIAWEHIKAIAQLANS